jgi:solute carrier family 36 (proton-coupled amino acid transporter)
MSTPKSFAIPRQPSSPFRTISFSNRDASPRTASLARLAQIPRAASPRTSEPGTPEPSTSTSAAVVEPQYDFQKIEPTAAGSYGSVSSRRPGPSALSKQDWTEQRLEDPEIIRKHLVSGFEYTASSTASTPPRNLDAETSRAVTAAGSDDAVPFSEEFSSLQLQGGDMTRQVYRFAEQSSPRSSTHGRSRSFSYAPPRRDDGEVAETVQDIMVPGGFRRNFIQRAYSQPVTGEEIRPTFVTRNFLHFLTLYGHFAGEDLEEWEDAITSGNWEVEVVTDCR